MIRTVNLTRVFRTEEIETSALNNVNMHVKKGEFVAIMGPSGCGKSTLLNIIGLLDNPSQGQYYFDGQEVSSLKERNRTLLRKGNIGFVFQSFNLIDELNVYENAELPLVYLKLSAHERQERVEKVLEQMKKYPEYKNVAVLVLTNFDEIDNEMRGLDLGAVDR